MHGTHRFNHTLVREVLLSQLVSVYFLNQASATFIFAFLHKYVYKLLKKQELLSLFLHAVG